jgi:uroporphyrinogen decarboxylase
MKPRDCVLAAGHLQPPERVPVTPYAGNVAARLTGTPVDRYCSSLQHLVSAQLEAQRMIGHDMVVAQSDGYYMAEGFGLTTRQRDNDTPVPVGPLLDAVSDVSRLRTPDPLTDGRMPLYLEAVKALRREVGDRLAVRATGTGPFSLAGHLLGTEKFVMQLAVLEIEPDPAVEQAIKTLMSICTETTARFALRALEAGADVVQIGDSLASLDMISPTLYRRWALPHERMFFEQVRPAAEARGGLGLLHICGDTTEILPDMAATGAHILEVDWKVDLAGAACAVDRRVALMGNLDPSAVLLAASPEAVARSARSAIGAAAGESGGFLLGSGCEVAPDTPLQNLRAMAQSVG